MKYSVTAILLATLLSSACGQLETRVGAEASLDADEAAANQLYIDDALDAAVEAASSTSVSADAESEIAASAGNALAEDRLLRIAMQFMTKIDLDSSGSVSLEEYLAEAEKRSNELGQDETLKAKVQEFWTAQFNGFAGVDTQASLDEVRVFLKNEASTVFRHRAEADVEAEQENADVPGEKVESEGKIDLDLEASISIGASAQ